jgi:hypothetical protein
VGAKVVFEDMDVSDNSAKTRIAQKYSFACPKLNYKKDIFKLENCVGE